MVEEPEIPIVEILQVFNSRVTILIILVSVGVGENRGKRSTVCLAKDLTDAELFPLILKMSI
jgi:hypothetical protein